MALGSRIEQGSVRIRRSNKVKKLVVLAAATVGFSAISMAQADLSAGSFSIRAGVAWPTTANLNGTFIGAGIDYDFGKSLFGGGMGSSTFFSFDWLSKSTSGRRGNIIPIMLNQRFSLATGESEGSLPLYGFIGVGAAILDFSPTSTQLAGRFGLGANLNTNVFFEGAFVLTGRGKGNNIQGNHIGVYLGYKF